MNHTCWSRGAILHSFLVCIVFYTSLHPTPVLLPGKSHGQKSLVGCSPWGREESDMTEQFPFHFSLSCIGEGSGNLLQCSCLENPKDGGDWWAAVCGITHCRTRLKWLSNKGYKSPTYIHFCLWEYYISFCIGLKCEKHILHRDLEYCLNAAHHKSL